MENEAKTKTAVKTKTPVKEVKEPEVIKLNLAEKLVDIQTKVLGLMKDGKAQNYMWTKGDKVINAIKPFMNEHKILLIPEVVETKYQRIDYFVKGGTVPKSEMFVSITLNMKWLDAETKEEINVPWSAAGMNDWDKGFGSALTYAERYFFLKFFHIETDKDDIDNPESKPEEKADFTVTSEQQQINNAQTPEELTSVWASFTKEQKTKYTASVATKGAQLKSKHAQQ